jgi:hypothetical protein
MVVASVTKEAGSTMTAAELQQFNNTRAKLFKGTIAVACVYAFIALAIILSLIFLPQARAILGGSLYPFTTTVIIGMIVVIIVLVLQVMNWLPTTSGIQYGRSDCPDFWDLEPVEDTSSVYTAATDEQKPYLNYKCKPRNYLKNSNTVPSTTYSATKDGKDAMNDLAYHTDSTGTGLNHVLGSNTADKISCNLVYPELLAARDASMYPDNPNATRCQWARVCGTPWTSVCPNVPPANVTTN